MIDYRPHSIFTPALFAVTFLFHCLFSNMAKTFGIEEFLQLHPDLAAELIGPDTMDVDQSKDSPKTTPKRPHTSKGKPTGILYKSSEKEEKEKTCVTANNCSKVAERDATTSAEIQKFPPTFDFSVDQRYSGGSQTGSWTIKLVGPIGSTGNHKLTRGNVSVSFKDGTYIVKIAT